jgi:peptide/nickel transport system substrate-binding protein
VRRALNYAVDRRKVTRLFGGASQFLLTCQLLPPNFPGYKAYCPYTVTPKPTGAWRGPDLARARRLVQASGTAGMPVTLWTASSGDFIGSIALPKYLLSVLREIGYPLARLHVIPNVNRYFSAIFKHPASIQADMSGWFADYVSASSFIRSQLSCRSLQNNLALFCDRALDAKMQVASQLQETDPAAAARQWAAIDRAITNAAPYVDLVNPIGLDFVSKRVGNYQHSAQWGLLLGQLWVH